MGYVVEAACASTLWAKQTKFSTRRVARDESYESYASYDDSYESYDSYVTIDYDRLR